MMPVGRITMVRTFPKEELVRAMSFVAVPGLIGPLLGPLAGGLIVGYLHWRMIFFVNLPIGAAGMYLVLRHMPDYRAERMDPIDFVGLSLFGSGIALLSYVLEIFGEHSLSGRSMAFLTGLSAILLLAYWRHTLTEPFPLLKLQLFRVRTFRAAVAGSYATRLGIGGMPFLLPLLYQIGLGYTPVQSGLLIMPQPLAAMGLKVLMPRILNRLGYRRVLLTNTVAIGLVIILFMAVMPGTPAAVILLMGFVLGFVSSMQYTSMNTLVFADLSDADASAGSSIASTSQQMSMSFGVAIASLLAAVFLGGNRGPNAAGMIAGIHWTFLTLGLMTIASSLVFRQLEPNDGANISRHRQE
jgi:MFS family permease